MKKNLTGELILLIFCLLASLQSAASAKPGWFNVADYGARGDSATLNTKAIQSAIDACAWAGGGTVYFPAGNYISGTLYLKNNLTLHLEAGAVLTGSGNLSDYPVTISGIRSYTDNYTDKSLLYGEGLSNIGITGEGTLDGNGTSFSGPYKVRPYMIRIINCRDVRVKGVTIRNSPMWVQHYLACENIVIEGITVNSRRDKVNNDGIDLDGCVNVRMSDCLIISGDDGIVLKSTLNQPCKNIVVTNCIISSDCNGFKLGTETNGGFENISFSNSVIYDTRLGGISLELVDGGILDRVTVSNITMDKVGAAIFIRLGNRARPFGDAMEKPGMGQLSNVTISNIQATNIGSTGCSVTGLPGHPVRNVSLNNIRLMFEGGGTREMTSREIPEVAEKYPEFGMFGVLPAYGFYCRHAENLSFNDVDAGFLKPDNRHAFVCDDVNGLELYRIKAMGGDAPLIRLYNVQNASVQSCRALPGTGIFVAAGGTSSRNIYLTNNDLNQAAQAVSKEDGAELYLEGNRLP